MNLKGSIKSPAFQNLIIGIIILDSIILGALTFSFLKNNSILIAIDRMCLLFFCIEMCVKILVLRKEFFLSKWNLFDLFVVVLSVLPTLIAIDRMCLLFFCIEMCVKILVLRKEFFLSKWNLFDLFVVVLSVLPTTIIGNIAILRLFRVLRAARLSSSVPQLRFVIAVITKSIPSVISIGILLLLVYYIYAVLGTQLFATAAPEYFGDLGKSFFTLFQVMTADCLCIISMRCLAHSFLPQLRQSILAIWARAFSHFFR